MGKGLTAYAVSFRTQDEDEMLSYGIGITSTGDPGKIDLIVDENGIVFLPQNIIGYRHESRLVAERDILAKGATASGG